MTGRTYPDERAGPFEGPPRRFTDAEGRDIAVRDADADDYDDLVAMYDAFDPEDRAQGIPPMRPDDVRKWVADLLGEECSNVVARHGDDVVGHATLVPDVATPGADDDVTATDAVDTSDPEEYELAIFVTRAYQGAGIGTQLLEALLGKGQADGVEYVWLTVERWNDPALALYRSVGFVTSNAETFELEMGIRL
ncbi:MAG: N-acetyltransferase family protein [Haloarculaceae archaeon]